MGRKKNENFSGVVYLITFPNGKKYVGITSTSFEERKRSHISHRNVSNLPVHNALNRYFGKEVWSIIATAGSWEELTSLEIQMIERHKSHISKSGYNLTLGGDGAYGYKHTDEQKERNRNSKKQYFSKPENRIKQSKANKEAHNQNPDQALEHSNFMKNRFQNPEERNKASVGMKKYLSDNENLEKHAIERGAKPFIVRTKDGTYVGEWLSQSECARNLDLSVSHINKCLYNKRKSHKGYIFNFKQI